MVKRASFNDTPPISFEFALAWLKAKVAKDAEDHALPMEIVDLDDADADGAGPS
jgi:hypothetical protein